ncbi:MAG TPA: hypothetical protein P5150_07630, partial [Candidatus Ratteibacteria bacterium]|nr:hypothetical protein [Candidatus Ratteibacteria bacterium]
MEKICIIDNNIFSDELIQKGILAVEKYYNPLIKFETHIISFEDCYKYQTRKIGTLIIHPFCEKQFKKTLFYPWRIIRVNIRTLARILKTTQIIKKNNFKLVIVYGISLYTFIGLVASKFLKKPLLLILHNDYDYMFKLKGKIKF